MTPDAGKRYPHQHGDGLTTVVYLVSQRRSLVVQTMAASFDSAGGFWRNPALNILMVLLVVFGTLTNVLQVRCVKIAVILPKDNSRRFSIQRIAPAISLALDQVDNMTLHGSIRGVSIRVRYADSKCHIAEAINQAFNFYMKGEVSVFFGPCCDYAAAPVARQITYWNVPMVTAGAMASDFGLLKKSTYPLLTRVGPDFNSLSKFLLAVLDYYRWRKVKLIYRPFGQEEVIEKFCHLAADGLHRSFLERQKQGYVFEQDYFKFIRTLDILNKLTTEIGNEYAGK